MEEPRFGSYEWDLLYHEPAIVVYDIFSAPLPPGALTGLALFRHLNKPLEEGEFEDPPATPEKSE